ncbi:MAG: hypothetical protein AAF827_12005 [Cyanobacteria bacterium P01_D01_bin.6]
MNYFDSTEVLFLMIHACMAKENKNIILETYAKRHSKDSGKIKIMPF